VLKLAGSPQRGNGSKAQRGQCSACVQGMKERLQSVVREMQADLQTQLKDEHLRLFSIVGRGGFGTVYHGACGCCRLVDCDLPQLLHMDCDLSQLLHMDCDLSQL
jgi:hypothetical protein